MLPQQCILLHIYSCSHTGEVGLTLLVRESTDVVDGVLVEVVETEEGVRDLELVPGRWVHLCTNIH
jgi:hypothetical protein